MHSNRHHLPILAATLMLGMLLGCASAAPRTAARVNAPAPANSFHEAVDALVQPMLRDRWLTGVAIGLVHPGGMEVYGYGADGRGHTPSGETLFEIGSITKVFTALLLADLAQGGAVQLDQPVASLLPPGTSMPEFEGKAITLAHLATHTSGLPRMPANFSPANPGNPYADYSGEQLFAAVAAHRLQRAPGEKGEYSNLGAGLLGDALAAFSGTTYEALVRERICRPLGMKDTVLTLSPEQQARFAVGHGPGGDEVPPWDFQAMAGAGGLRSSVNDMLLFLRAAMGVDGTTLAPAFALALPPRTGHDANNEIGLGWLFSPANKIHWHNGQTGGFHSFMAFKPDERVGVVVLANDDGAVVDQLGSAALRMLRGRPYALELPRSVEVPRERLERLVGSYRLTPEHVFTITLRGEILRAQLTGQPALPVYPETETRFLYRAVPAALSFQIDEQGRVQGLTLHQNGRDLPALRLPEEAGK